MSNEFWAFSLKTYSAEGVAERLLAVQDEMGLDVNILLYATWLAVKGRKITDGHLAELEARVEPWRKRVVVPLRQLRTQLRDYPEAQTVREQVKELELKSEHQQQAMMWEFFNRQAALPEVACPLEDNLNLVKNSTPTQSPAWEVLFNQLVQLIQS